MPFGLPGVALNFQTAIYIIFKPVLGRYVSANTYDVIILSPSFTYHVKHLREVFKLLQEAGLTLNREKGHFAGEELPYLGLVIRKEGTQTNEAKIKAITEMKPPKNAREVAKFFANDWAVSEIY
ncbi:hypothetical protein TNCV_776291 [Trichonephila clavipes]|nr:hypothetical protein TNCV_776291 [Trichonephila clavipes]